MMGSKEELPGKVSGFAALQSDSRNVGPLPTDREGEGGEESGVDSRQREDSHPIPSHEVLVDLFTLSPLIEMSPYLMPEVLSIRSAIQQSTFPDLHSIIH